MQAFRRHALISLPSLCLGFAAIAFQPSDQQQSIPVREENGTIQAARTFPKSQFEQPVERKNPDGTPLVSPEGKRQFEVRFHNPDGTDTIEPVTPTSGQEKLEKPTIFYRDNRNEQGQVTSHLVYTFLTPEQGGMLLVNYTTYKKTADNIHAQSPAAVQDGVYHVGKYPVHADKDAYSRFFYHLTVVEGQPPILVIPRVDTDLFNQRSKATYPGRVIAGALNLPDYYANIRNNFDYSVMESPKGDRWRDWIFVDARSNITYFQLIPTHKLQKGKDGIWDVHVSKEPPPLIDIRKTK
jgi:hypothetical protein